MKKFFILLALVAMSISCSNNNKKQATISKSDLIGSWYQESTGAASSNGVVDNQALYYMKDFYTLESNGSYIAETEIKFIHNNKVAIEEKIHTDGKWESKGDSITTYLDRLIIGNDTTIVNNKGGGNTVKIIHLSEDSIVFQKMDTEKHNKKMLEGKMSFGSFRVGQGTSYGVLYKIRNK
jgi:hypothetical protein